MNRGALVLLFVAVSTCAAAQAPLTLDEALSEAHAANARLPLPAYDVAIAREKRSEARADRWLRVAVEGDFIYAPPSGYDPVVTNLGEFKLQAVGRQPIFDGGARRGAVARAEAELDSAAGRYRIAEKDLVLDVTSRYMELLAAQEEAAARREGIARLEGYRSLLRSRQASGQAVAADRLKTEVRVAAEEANVLEAEKRAADARLALNDLMGREPRVALEIAPLPPPDVSLAVSSTDAAEVPEVASAQADARAADAALAIARAERRPRLDLAADFGFWGSDTSRLVPLDLKLANPDATFGDRIRRDFGYSISLFFSWPIFDFGTIRARIAQADLTLRQAQQKVEVARRDARLKWEQARSTIEILQREIDLLSRAAPAARDASLEAESRYRGGAATSLEVLDAYASAIDSAVRLSDAMSRYRIARALLSRWGDSLRRWAVLFIAATLLSCKGGGQKESASKADPTPEAPTPVRVAAVSRQTLPVFVSGPGKTSALVQQKVRAPFAGTLTSLSVSDGDPVQRGQIVGSIVARDSEAALSGAREMLREAATPSEKRDAERAVAIAEKNLVRKPLTVAWDGAVISHAASPGDRLAEDQEILAVNDASSLVFLADVPQADLLRIRPGQKAMLQIAGGSQLSSGSVHAVLPGANAADYTGSVRIDLPPSSRRLAVGIFGTARILVSERADAAVVPDAAVLRDDVSGTARVALVSQDRAHWVTVQTGVSDSGKTEVVSPPLSVGQTVIVSGLVGLPEGKLVSPQP